VQDEQTGRGTHPFQSYHKDVPGTPGTTVEVASRLKENQSPWSSSNPNPKYPKSCQATKSASLFFFWLRLAYCTLPVHRGLREEHSWSLVLHRLLTAAHTRAASACNAYSRDIEVCVTTCRER